MTGQQSNDSSESGDSDGRPQLANQRDINEVYQPAADSKLLADTVVERIGGGLVIDVGTGTGYVAERIRSETAANVVGTDLNRKACEQTAEKGVPVVCGDLVSAFGSGTADVVCCNPPYLPTPPDQEWDDRMERALSGGETGRAVIDTLLGDLDRVLTKDGVAYLLLSSLTGPEAVRERAHAEGFETETASQESHAFETLFVFEFQ